MFSSFVTRIYDVGDIRYPYMKVEIYRGAKLK